jgi:hypothetical protein
MKKSLALIVAALAMILGASWAFTSGANYELRGYSPAERMSILDTTTIGVKWMLVGSGMMALAFVCLVLAAIFFLRSGRKIIA